MSTSFRWRRSSTPLFPGAWPNTSSSTQGQASISDAELGQGGAPSSQGKTRNSDQRKSGTERSLFPTRLEKLPFEDSHGVGLGIGSSLSADAASGYFDDRPLSPASPELVSAHMSASLSQDSYLTDTASEGVVTPELAYPPDTPWIMTIDNSRHDREHFRQRRGGFMPIDEKCTTMNPKITIGLAETNPSKANIHSSSRSSSVYLDAPLLPFTPGLPPLSLQSSERSLGYVTAPLCPSDTPPIPPSPGSISSSIPSSFVIPSPNPDTGYFDSQHAPVTVATDFYPVPDAEPDTEEIHRTPSSSFSSHSLNTDSPVLPSHNSPGLLAIPTQALSPTSADLDAFALAAASAASESSLSIPTSLHTASMSVSAYDTSACETTRERSYTVPSAIASSAVAEGACGSRSTDAVQHCDYGQTYQCGLDSDPAQRARRRSVPMPRASMTRSLRSRVDVDNRQGALGRERPKKLVMLGRMRKLGGKFLNLFKAGKNGGEAGDRLGVQTMTTTAVTAVEYRSEHPIPSPRVPRRLHAPPTVTPPNSPQSDRRQSFHPLDDANNRPLISLPKARNSMAVKSPPRAAMQRSKGNEPLTPSPQIRISRARTQTAPPESARADAGHEANLDVLSMRRFSLSSALSKQRLDALRATLLPHPSLPVLPPPLPTREHDTAVPQSPSSPSAADRKYDFRRSRAMELAPAFEQIQPIAGSSTTQNLMPPLSNIARLSRTPPPSPIHLHPHRLNVPQSPSPLSPPNTPRPVDIQTRGRSRGFSFSSAISKRALRARSMMVAVGRRDKEDDTLERGSPAEGTAEGRGRDTTATTVTDGVQFDMLTPSSVFSAPAHLVPETPERRVNDQDAGSEHAPTVSELGSMSFAHTREIAGSNYSSSTDFDLSDIDSMNSSFVRARSKTFGGRDDEVSDRRNRVLLGDENEAPLTRRLQLSQSMSFAVGTSFGTQPDELNELAVAELEEEQGFMRALGLEFDAIARRAACE